SQAYLPVGDLSVRLEPAAGADAAGAAAPAAERILDLRRAEHRVLAEDGEHLTVVSAADDVLVHAMPCPEAARPVLELDSPRHEGDRLLVVCAIATTWQGLGRTPDRAVHEALEEATAQAELALARGEAELRRRHRDRNLPGAHEVALRLDGSAEAELLATSFAYGRYLLASASRPGLPPATLQGLWNAQLEAPWSSNYTVNINLEMNHWAAGVAHVPDAAAAL